MLRQRCQPHPEVITAVSVWMVALILPRTVSLELRTFADISHVTFRDLTDDEITDYLRKVESFDKGRRLRHQGEGASLVVPHDRLPRHYHTPATRLIIGIPRPRERRGRRMLSDQFWLSLAVA